tara:strand:- start:409 stop:657 length:249 start_codon:yes stop_codon:yes gene_type:complete
MFRRLVVAILRIMISGLKFICNMLSLGVSWASGKKLPLFGILSEGEESGTRSHYVVDNHDHNHSDAMDLLQDEDEYESPIKW